MDEVLDLLVTETNQYAQANLSRLPNARAWSDVSIEEMKAFIGVTILMLIIQLPRLEMYWKTNNPMIATSGVSNIRNESNTFPANLLIPPPCQQCSSDTC